MSFKSFFCPNSVAVIGAAREEGKVGHTIVDNIIASRYKGNLYLINPKADEIHGIKCFDSILDIQDDVELAIIVIPSKYISKVIEECAEKNCKFAIIISAGFKETGIKGAIMERRLIEKAKNLDIRILGPNCLGMIDTTCPLNASFSANMPKKGDIGFITQSGALGTAVLDWAKSNKIGFSKIVSLGNKADISENDLFEDWLKDDKTKVITAYIEGVKNGKDFLRISSKVTKKKPIIIIKSGNTDAGAKAVSSHTGTLAGSSKAYEAAFKQSGIIRADTLKQLFDYSIALSGQPIPKGNNVAIITNAGGPGIMATDACEINNINIANLQVKTIDKLKKFLPPAANFYNPVDVLGDALADRYEKTLEVISKDKNINAIIVILTPQAMTESLKTAKAIVETSQKIKNTPILVCFMGGAEVKKGINYLVRNKIPTFDIPEEAVATLKIMIDYGNWKKTKPLRIDEFDVDVGKVKKLFDKCREEDRLEIAEVEAREVLEAYNIPVPKAKVAADIEDAKKAIKNIKYPVVLKIVSPDILHKTDVGGIKVGIRNDKELEENFDQIIWDVKKYMPDANIRGILIQEMIESNKETIIGMSRDPQFGPMLMFGLGGIYVEVLKDVSFRIAPISRGSARRMVEEIKAIKLLKGARGEEQSDIESIVEVLMKMSQLVTDFPEIIEMDINPLFVNEIGKGSIAADARIRIGG